MGAIETKPMTADKALVEAKALLKQELGKNRTYEQLRNLKYNGYADYYLQQKKEHETLTTKADLNTMIQFARFDYTLGATIAEMIFDCCKHAPKKEFVENILALDKTTDKATLVTSLFDYKSKNGANCLIVSFAMPIWYRNKTGAAPDATTGLMPEINKTIRYLIKLGDDHKVDMARVLNQTTKTGQTLFMGASSFSEEVASDLLRRRCVDVNTVNNIFMTPSFKVSKLRVANLIEQLSSDRFNSK